MGGSCNTTPEKKLLDACVCVCMCCDCVLASQPRDHELGIASTSGGVFKACPTH